jgi:hypothetical protein
MYVDTREVRGNLLGDVLGDGEFRENVLGDLSSVEMY